MWQRGLMGLALSRRWNAIIYLGSPNYVSTWISALLARLTGKRVLFWSHGWTKPPTGVRSLTRNIFYSLAHDLLLYGRWAKTIAIAQGFDPSRVHVVSNSLDVEAQRRALAAIPASRPAEVRRELFGEDRTPVLCCTTRLTRLRRLDMLLDAVAQLRDQGKPSNVAIIGDGPERSNLQAQAERLNLKVAFLGACYDEGRIGEVLLASNACVAPGQVGLTAMHALAFGVPVISHGDPSRQMPEFESIVPGVTGSLFEEGSVQSLASAIEPWIRASTIDPATRQACRTMIDRFWNPSFQTEVILRAVDGEPADDLFWLRPRAKESWIHA
jgi:glycosyltransferase involved in cell wall biosynthesis